MPSCYYAAIKPLIQYQLNTSRWGAGLREKKEKGIQWENIFLRQRSGKQCLRNYDSVPYKIFYFPCPHFGFKWVCLLKRFSVLCLVLALHIAAINNRHRLGIRENCQWKNESVRVCPFLAKSFCFHVFCFSPNALSRLVSVCICLRTWKTLIWLDEYQYEMDYNTTEKQVSWAASAVKTRKALQVKIETLCQNWITLYFPLVTCLGKQRMSSGSGLGPAY